MVTKDGKKGTIKGLSIKPLVVKGLKKADKLKLEKLSDD